MLAAALCTLAITVTALAAELINAEQARSIAAQWVPAGSTHLVTKDGSFEFVPHYDVKFYDNKTNTAYEIEVLRNGGKVREFKMEAQTVLGSPKIVLSVNDVQNLVRKEFPNAVFTKVELDRGDGMYALIDYVNFKGEGTNPAEHYRGIGWGLRQVLEEMRSVSPGQPAAVEFAEAAKRVLQRRVDNSPPGRGEARWLAGWWNRCDSYKRNL